MFPPHEIDFAPYFYARHCLPDRDDAMMLEAQELRFKVYCEECHFLACDDFPNGREFDEFDKFSVHFCAFNLSHELVGYARLVLPDGAGKFPFERYCNTYANGITLPAASSSAEISRMIVRADYRRRRGDNISGATNTEDVERGLAERRSNSPQILLSLYKRMYLYSIDHGIQNWYAAMERPVARALARIGAFTFHDIGPEQDYFGPVAPYIANLDDIATSVTSRNIDMLNWLRRPVPDASLGGSTREGK